MDILLNHWDHTEAVEEVEFREFMNHSVPFTPSEPLEANLAVYVVCDKSSRRLEGIYDPYVKGVRPIKGGNAPNRDLRLYNDALQNPNITILAADGLTGTGKTSTVIRHLIDTHLASVRLGDNMDASDLAEEGAHKVLIAKPAVNSGGEEYGFLPGDINEKIIPTIRNYTQYFDRYHVNGFEALSLSGHVEVLPLGFIRGTDAENVSVIVDECQNTKELVTVVTRRADFSRFFLLGDTSPFQIDLQGNTPKKNGLVDIIDLLRGAPYFQYIEMKSLEHIVRSDEVRDVVRRLFKKYGKDPKEWVV